MALSAVLVGIGLRSPRLMLQDYPKDVQAAVPPKTAAERRETVAAPARTLRHRRHLLWVGGRDVAVGMVAAHGGVPELATGSSVALGPALVVAGGAAGWGAAVVILSRSGKLRRPLLVTGLQALIGGALQLVVGVAAGEPAQLVPWHLIPAIPAFVYLVVVASLIGYPLLTWLLSEVPVHVANTGAYVAPVIALGLGWLLLAEPVTQRTVGGVGVILTGVALVVWSNRRTHRAAEADHRVAADIRQRAA